ncbi:MAG: hypothetical protein JXR77_13200 [Lentisphaeria bacterium]|nr:hypothetical protein [Lentisphaeria bacterium]
MSIRSLAPVTLLVLCALCLVAGQAAGEEKRPQQWHAVIIQGAGYLPGTEPPAGTDALTKATSREINTYSLTAALVEKLTALGMTATVLPFSECGDLACLGKSPDGTRTRVDVVIFAGPSHFSKQPPQLTSLYPKIKEAAARNPGLICSTLVPAWYPDTKGQATMELADKAFREAGARSLPGTTILTPRKENKGASPEEVQKALTDFATRLVQALQNTK